MCQVKVGIISRDKLIQFSHYKQLNMNLRKNYEFNFWTLFVNSMINPILNKLFLLVFFWLLQKRFFNTSRISAEIISTHFP